MEQSQGPLTEEIFHSFLQLAVKRQASDVHFEVGYPPTYRVYGELLAAKYPPYAAARPAGPLLVVTPTAWAGWTAADSQ